ncbi:MAG: TetR/AcrR family transcriptional regulator [Propionibacteriaceae bacterium]|nr:TetR/AcrR family transcriptional regulator [Propionibacteriaceae bacterium]
MTELTARRAATRDRLIDAAAVVFGEKGVLGAAVEEICEEAGFTRGAFYSNFSSKDDLCLALLERLYDHQTAALDQVIDAIGSPTGDLEDLIRRALEVFFAAQPEGRNWVLTSQVLRLHAARSPEFAAAYRRFNEQGIARVADTIEGVLASLGYELTTNGVAAISLLHAVHEYGALGSLIGSDALEDGYAAGLMATVLGALIRPVSSTSAR